MLTFLGRDGSQDFLSIFGTCDPILCSMRHQNGCPYMLQARSHPCLKALEFMHRVEWSDRISGVLCLGHLVPNIRTIFFDLMLDEEF